MANPPAQRGLSLYANLLDADSSSTISKGPVVFKTAETAEEAPKKHQIDLASLRFQPTKRPQLSQKPKAKSTFPKAAPADLSTQRIAPPPVPVSQANARPAKTTLAEWTEKDDEDVNGFYQGEKRQRGGKRKRKNNNNREEHVVIQDWDDIYDPTRPNSYEEYKHSDEKVREVREWKDRLYAHRMARKASSDKDSDEEEYKPQINRQFAPPGMSFAPPPMDMPTIKSDSPKQDTVDDPYSPEPPSIPPPPPPPLESIPPPIPTSEAIVAGSISRAPVRYSLPAAPSDIPSSEAELAKALAAEVSGDEEEEAEENVPRSLRPGQKGFAQRLMSKYGWSKGKGLGADNSGIINPLSVQLEKRKKKSDAEGGGFRNGPGGRGKIVGGKRNVTEKTSAEKAEEEGGKFGPMSEVIVLRGMVDGMNLDEEVDDGGLMQEIGEECGEKYGRVERVFIDRHDATPKVYVKFTSQLSALRAVNALEGRNFGGNTISALFYNTEKFELGIYDL